MGDTQAATGPPALPRLNDPDDPVLQQESSWLATKLRRGNCGIEVDMTHALELVGQKEKVDLFVPYVSDGVRLELRFPVSEPERASAEQLRKFVRAQSQPISTPRRASFFLLCEISGVRILSTLSQSSSSKPTR